MILVKEKEPFDWRSSEIANDVRDLVQDLVFEYMRCHRDLNEFFTDAKIHEVEMSLLEYNIQNKDENATNEAQENHVVEQTNIDVSENEEVKQVEVVLRHDEGVADKNVVDESVADVAGEDGTDEIVADKNVADGSLTDKNVVDDSVPNENVVDDSIPNENVVDDSVPNENVVDNSVVNEEDEVREKNTEEMQQEVVTHEVSLVAEENMSQHYLDYNKRLEANSENTCL